MLDASAIALASSPAIVTIPCIVISKGPCEREQVQISAIGSILAEEQTLISLLFYLEDLLAMHGALASACIALSREEQAPTYRLTPC
jgi:hypothetical protein